MSVLGYLKNMVIEEVPETSKAAPPLPPKPTIPVPSPESIDPAIKKILEQEVQLAAHPAYSQFLSLSESMSTVIPDENTRFRAALAALAPQNIAIKDILFDVDECIQALDKKEREATAASAKARQARVGSREAELKNIRLTAARLQDELAKANADSARLEAELADEVRKIEETEAQFAAAITSYRKELNERKDRISFLGKV